MGSPAAPSPSLRIGNCSGFYGDRYSAMPEMLEGGDLDVLASDYLAEATMLILARDRAKNPAVGYADPDTTARLDSIAVTQVGTDRVRVHEVRGETPPPDLEVPLDSVGGVRNEVTVVLTGLDNEPRAELARRQVADALPARPRESTWELVRTSLPDSPTEELASARLTVVGRDTDPAKVGRAFSNTVVQIAPGTVPDYHMTAPPSPGQNYGVFAPGCIPQDAIDHVAVLPDGRRELVEAPTVTISLTAAYTDRREADDNSEGATGPGSKECGTTRRLPLGTIAAARSCVGGPDANIGAWVREEFAFDRLDKTLTVEHLRLMLPECQGLIVTGTVLPNLRAVNFVISGLLGEGVAYDAPFYNARFDPRAKALEEWLRSRTIDIPEQLLTEVGQ